MKKVNDYMEKFIDGPEPILTEIDKEFNKYCDLYKEKFNKNAYVADLMEQKNKQ